MGLIINKKVKVLSFETAQIYLRIRVLIREDNVMIIQNYAYPSKLDFQVNPDRTINDHIDPDALYAEVAGYMREEKPDSMLFAHEKMKDVLSKDKTVEKVTTDKEGKEQITTEITKEKFADESDITIDLLTLKK